MTAHGTTLVVGPGDQFLSGVSYYTAQLSTALARDGRVGVLLLRRLCPRRLYPGWRRVGRTDGTLSYPGVSAFNGLDWYWFPSAIGAWRFYRSLRPSTVVLQWWTATAAHTYLAMAWLARRHGARVILELHEVQDVGEAAVPLAGRYARAGLRRLLRHTAAVVVHSAADRDLIRRRHPGLAAVPVEVIPHAPFGQYAEAYRRRAPVPSPPDHGEPVRLLVFGVIRPYKGHADLADALPILRRTGPDVHVTVVGEVWQGYREPLRRLAEALPPDRLTVVDRYVADHEVPGFFADAHVVVLPYRRSSASGPLHLAMSLGLPVVTTAVGGLAEASDGYSGAVLVPPQDPAALAVGIRAAVALIGHRHPDVHSWDRTADRFTALIHRLAGPAPAGEPTITVTTKDEE